MLYLITKNQHRLHFLLSFVSYCFVGCFNRKKFYSYRLNEYSFQICSLVYFEQLYTLYSLKLYSVKRTWRKGDNQSIDIPIIYLCCEYYLICPFRSRVISLSLLRSSVSDGSPSMQKYMYWYMYIMIYILCIDTAPYKWT
jgi:hypothetical protein